MSAADETNSASGRDQASSAPDEPDKTEQTGPASEAQTPGGFGLGGDIDAELAEMVAGSDGEAVPDELTILTKERDDYLDTLRRLQADFDNYRKREKANIALEVGRVTEKIVARLIPVLDTFELALGHEVDRDASPVAKLHDQLFAALEAEGLERLAPDGQPFDPAEAEAVLHEAGEAGDEGVQFVSEVLRAGYRWKGRVVRAAMVKVRG